MRLIKMIGLAAVAAMAAMAFVGATSASATSTQLCTTHTALTCSSAAESVGFLGSGTLLSDLVDVLCLHVHGTALALALANPQQLHSTLLHFLGCGTKSTHNNCTVTVLEQPLFNLLKTGLDHGTLTSTNGLTLVICDNIDIFGIDIHCVYDGTGLQFLVGAQHLTASNTPVDKAEDLSLCPEESALDGLLATTANRYILA